MKNSIYKKKDKTPFIGSVSAVAVQDEKGNILFYDGIIEDISIRKEAEKKLRESEEKYRTLIEQSIQGIVILQGIPPRPVFASPAVTDISGYTVEEIHALSSEDMQSQIHPEDKSLIIENYRKQLQGEELPSQFELRIIRKGGDIRWIDVHSKVIHYSGSPAIQAIFVDITERKKAEKQMKKFNEELERRISERSKRIELFLTAKQKLETEKTWERGLNTIIESIGQLGLDRSGIFLINHLTGKMEFHSGRGFDLPEVNRSISLKKKDYYAVRAILEKRTIHIQDVTSIQGAQIAPDVHSLVWIPIIVQDEAFAALAAGNTDAHNPISSEDVKDLEILAGMCGAFIDRTRVLVEPVAEKTLTTKSKHWLEPSRGYLVIEKRPKKSLDIFRDLVTHGIPGFIVSREYPEKIKREYMLLRTPVLWLSRYEIEKTLNPDDLPKLNYIINDFTGKCEESVVLLDGVEYLITQIGFESVIKYLQELKDIMVLNRSRLIIPLHKDAIAAHEFGILEKEFAIY